jgi:hypothetical protein
MYDIRQVPSLVVLIHGVDKSWTVKSGMMNLYVLRRWLLTTCLDIRISCGELHKAKVRQPHIIHVQDR